VTSGDGARLFWSLALLFGPLACGGEAVAPGEPAHCEAPEDGACRTREVLDGTGCCVCPADDALCKTRGFAHFTISNVAGSGLPNEVSYEAGDGVVLDRVTGLVWEAVASPERSGWADAKARCAALELGGHDDFRLPGRIELVTILDFDELPVAASVFEDVVSDYHFSSSPASFAPGSAYSVYFGAGETTIASASPGSALSRCVAGAVAAPPAPQFEVTGEGVLDRVTGLLWEPKFGPAAGFGEASARCEALGMRLPSIRELQSIVDENQHAPALDPAVFPDAGPERAWSQTLRGGDRWYVDFADGKTYADVFEDDSLASRCVR
jgi:hypothetical protein